MRELNPKIELQELIGQQILNVLQSTVTDTIRRNCEGIFSDLNFRSVMEGNSLKVNKTLLPQFYALSQEAWRALHFFRP